MPLINVPKREISCKIVYYGPGLSGKTTNLEVIHKKAPRPARGELTSIATEGDRTLFFDYMNLDLGSVAGMKTKFQLYTVPGQPYYNATRKLVLQGADGIVFVADSQPDRLDETVESLQNLVANLKEQGLDLATIPLVIQWNKRDLPGVLPVDELERKLNKLGAPTFEAVAVTGEGVLPTLKKIAQLTLEKLNQSLQERPGEVVRASSRRERPKPERKPTPAPPSAPARPTPAPPAPPRPAAREAASLNTVRPEQGAGAAGPESKDHPPQVPFDSPLAARGARSGRTAVWKIAYALVGLASLFVIAWSWDLFGLRHLVTRLLAR